MDEPDVIDGWELTYEFGTDVYELMLSYDLHHLDDRRRPFWTGDVVELLLYLIQPELRDVDDGR